MMYRTVMNGSLCHCAIIWDESTIWLDWTTCRLVHLVPANIFTVNERKRETIAIAVFTIYQSLLYFELCYFYTSCRKKVIVHINISYKSVKHCHNDGYTTTKISWLPFPFINKIESNQSNLQLSLNQKTWNSLTSLNTLKFM